jgi:hypothetical protein
MHSEFNLFTGNKAFSMITIIVKLNRPIVQQENKIMDFLSPVIEEDKKREFRPKSLICLSFKEQIVFDTFTIF